MILLNMQGSVKKCQFEQIVDSQISVTSLDFSENFLIFGRNHFMSSTSENNATFGERKDG